MKLSYDKKSKDPVYYAQIGFRNGQKTSTRNYARIGKHSELLAISDDPLAYAIEQIATLNEEFKNNKVTMEVKIDFDEKVKASDHIVSTSNILNIGYFVLQSIYHDLEIHSFFEKVTADSKITFDPNQINRFLTYARILEPDSKLGTFGHLHRYYEQPSFNYVHILRTMDLLEANYDAYISHLFEASSRIVPRDTSVCYFDCTNYYFETECNDEDYIDEVTGELTKGLRKYGPSKEHRPNPLVQMGLFMDSNGIPISMCINPGSDNEQICAIPEEEKVIKLLKGKKFIYCSDGGLGSFNIRKFNSMGGRAFVVTQSIKKLSEAMKEAVFNDYDYRMLSTDQPATIEFLKGFDKKNEEYRPLYLDKAYKVITADKLIDVGLLEEKTYNNGKTTQVKSKATLRQKVIITFSRQLMEYQRTIRNKQIERAKKLLINIDPETYKKGNNDVTRFIKRVSKTKSGEQVEEKYMIDQNVIEEEEKYDGFYAIATNLDDHPKEIIAINSRRNKIEDCFRIMKTNLSARPVFHSTKERIIAHFMICYTALLIYRLLSAKLDSYGKHFTIDEVIETLKNMEVVNMDDLYYRATYNGSQVLTAINGIFKLDLDRKHYQPKTLNKKIKNISK